jgi:DNA-binding transcriptional MerR regulator
MVDKAAGAFRTIGEISAELGLPQHILRYWETRFPQLRPMTRSGNRRYYRPEDVELVRRINHLLHVEGYTVKGVQKLLAGKEAPTPVQTSPAAPQTQAPARESSEQPVLPELLRIREKLARALAAA